jgi:hypothetical protein
MMKILMKMLSEDDGPRPPYYDDLEAYYCSHVCQSRTAPPRKVPSVHRTDSDRSLYYELETRKCDN